MTLRHALLVAWLGLFCAGCATSEHYIPTAGADATETRRLLNQHIIAVDENGLAIEPYTYRYGGHPRQVDLQTHLYERKGADALHAIGYTTNEINDIYEKFRPALGKTNFVFRDVVIPEIIEKAKNSGKRIVIYVHGGLNPLDDAIGRAERMLLNESKQGTNECYPIFICWPSDLPSSYRQHIWDVRNGVSVRRANEGWKRSTAPLYVVTDVATSIVRLPRVSVDLARSDHKTAGLYAYREIQDAHVRYYALQLLKYSTPDRTEFSEVYEEWRSHLEAWETNDLERLEKRFKKKVPQNPSESDNDYNKRLWEELAGNLINEWRDTKKLHPDWAPIDVSLGEYRTTFWDKARRKVLGWGLAAPKLVIAGSLSATGSESWGMMCRRVDAMFQHERSFRPGYSVAGSQHTYEETNSDVRESNTTGIGAMSVLLRALAQAQEQTNGLKSVDFYGHSMGAIAINRALRDFPNLKVDRIVYMGAACSIKDFSRSVVPYLRACQTTNTQFYNLCLNPRGEERELSLWEWVPRGSLLIWIDEFLRRPDSFEDRVMGHFENALLASRIIPPSVQSRVHMVSMSAGEPQSELGDLQKHGSFNHYRFWAEEFPRLSGSQTIEREKYRLPTDDKGKAKD